MENRPNEKTICFFVREVFFCTKKKKITISHKLLHVCYYNPRKVDEMPSNLRSACLAFEFCGFLNKTLPKFSLTGFSFFTSFNSPCEKLSKQDNRYKKRN